MKKSIFSILILALSIQLFSQEFEVPDNYKFETDDDYTKYESDVIKGVTWLIDTPLEKEPDKRKEVNKFLMMWLTGTPNVTIEISQEIVTFLDCADCLMVFMGGWAKYALENDYSKNLIKGNLAGVESVIEFYERNKKTLGKIKEIQNYKKLRDKGELENHIESKL